MFFISTTPNSPPGGNPELVRESQKKRYDSVELVDEVLTLYNNWNARE